VTTPSKPSARPAAPEPDPRARRAMAARLFNRVWTLLETPDRTPEQIDEMIHAAHASRYHWGEVGEPVNLARGEWQCARVYSVLGRGEPALWHARRCLEINEAAKTEDFDLAAAYEAMARASLAAGDQAACAEWKTRGVAALEAIRDPEDRQVVEDDLALLP
jgi:hypothetical protein